MPGEVIYTGLFHPSLLFNLCTLVTDSEPDYSASWPMLRRKPEKAMAPHPSTLAWQIPWMEEPGRLQSMWSLGVRHDWVTSLSFFTFMHWRRKWKPTPVFLPGESQGWGSLVGCHLWGCRVGHDWSDLIAAAAVGNCWSQSTRTGRISPGCWTPGHVLTWNSR